MLFYAQSELLEVVIYVNRWLVHWGLNEYIGQVGQGLYTIVNLSWTYTNLSRILTMTSHGSKVPQPRLVSGGNFALYR